MANIDDYASTYASFEWERRGMFNIGRGLIDNLEDRTAMIWLGTSGEGKAPTDPYEYPRQIEFVPELPRSRAVRSVASNSVSAR